MSPRAIFLVSLSLTAAAGAEMNTARWGNGPGVQHAKTVKYDAGTLSLELSALSKQAKVCSARLFMSPVKWNDPAFELVADKQSLALVEPYFQWYDATAAAAAWVKAGTGTIQVLKGPKVDPDAVILELAYEAPVWPATQPAELPKQAGGVRASYRSGQVFLTFKEIDPPDGGKDQVSWADLAGKFKGDYYGPVPDPRSDKQITYRVYAHEQPITAANIGTARLVAEVLPGSALNTRMSLQIDPAKKTQQMVAANAGRSGEGLATGPQVIVLRSAVEPGKPVEPGVGICVHTVSREGKAYYAVLTAVNGVTNARDISPANAVGPVEQKPAAPEPVLYRESTAPVGGTNYVEQWYSYWTLPPLSPWPARYDVVVGYCPELLGKPAALHVARGGWNVWPTPPAPRKTDGLTLSHAADEPVDMGVGELESTRTQKGFTSSRFVPGFANRLDALVRWAKAAWPVDPNRVSANLGDWGMQEIRRGDTFCLIRGWGLPEYTKGWQTFQRAVGQWGPPALYRDRPDAENPYALSDVTDWVLANPKTELPFVIMHARGGSHFSEMGWPPAPRFLSAMTKTKRAFIYAGKGNPAEDAINRGLLDLRLDLSAPAFGNCTLDDNPGQGEIGSGENFRAQLNGYLLWDSASIVDEPARYQLTAWVDASSFYPDCRVDLTPRRCRKFKAAPGAKFAWTNTLLEGPPARSDQTPKAPATAPAQPAGPAGKSSTLRLRPEGLIQSGTAVADENGLVTLEKLGLTKGKHRLEIKLP